MYGLHFKNQCIIHTLQICPEKLLIKKDPLIFKGVLKR